MKNSLIAMILLAGCLMPACRGEGSTSQPQITGPAMSVLITERNCLSLEVPVGTQVVWTNKGTQVHVVQSEPADDGSRLIDSGELQMNDSFSFTFLEPGIYDYQCTLDGSMTGRITVRQE